MPPPVTEEAGNMTETNASTTVEQTPQCTTSKEALNPPPSLSAPSTPTATQQQQQPAPALPIIDISPFLDPTASRAARLATASALNAACLSYGFFYLVGHGIPLSTLDTIIELARSFFALPLQEKMVIKRFDAGGPEGGDSARGYQAVGENVSDGLLDVQEAVDWYAEWGRGSHGQGDDGGVSDGGVKVLQGRNLWPQRPPEMKGVYEGYVEEVKKVGRAVVHAMGVGLGLGPRREGGGGRGRGRGEDDADADDDDEEDEEIFVRKCKDSFWVMRAIHYPPLPCRMENPSSSSADQEPRSHAPGPPRQFSCGAHTDYGCITLLLADPTPSALQVQLKDGAWLNADPLRGAFVVNIGDMMERWTNGLWKSTLHRVMYFGDGGEDGGRQGRISVPFFYEPGFEVEVKALRKFGGGAGRQGQGQGQGKGQVGTYGEHLLTKVFSNFYYSKRTEW